MTDDKEIVIQPAPGASDAVRELADALQRLADRTAPPPTRRTGGILRPGWESRVGEGGPPPLVVPGRPAPDLSWVTMESAEGKPRWFYVALKFALFAAWSGLMVTLGAVMF